MDGQMLDFDRRVPARGRGRAAAAAVLVAALLAAAGCKGSKGDPGAPGSTKGAATVAVIDLDSRAPIAGATVTTEPGGLTAETDAAGQVSFPSLAAGLYRFSASAASLRLQGTSVVAGGPVAGSTDWVSVVAGATSRQAIELARLDAESMNLGALHAGGPAFGDANCVACHGDRKGETSADPARKPWHAIGAHAARTCTSCHATVELVEHSGAALRRQVDPAICVGCHPNYPASF